jgi:cytochrome oxidase assembly protein ShyY1
MSWRFALQPKWIVRHVLVVLLCGGMIALGLWQLRRADEKRDYRDRVEAQQAIPVGPVEAVIPVEADPGDDDVEAILYRSVEADGTYADDDTFVVENRTLDGTAGAWVLTPLVLDDGAAVVINRGFLRYDREGLIVPPPPPAGRVHVEGLVFPSQVRGRFGPQDPLEGTLEVLARVDLARFAAQVDYPVLPAYVQLVTSDPPQPPASPDAPELVALGEPEPDLGPHLSYAAQWAIFTTIAAGGYVLLLRRVAKDHARAEAREQTPEAEQVDSRVEG